MPSPRLQQFERHAFDAALQQNGSQAYEKNTGRKEFEDKFEQLFTSLLDQDSQTIKSCFLRTRACPCCTAEGSFALQFIKFQIPIVSCNTCKMVFASPCLSNAGEEHLLEDTSVWTDEHISFLTSPTYEKYAKLRYGYELSVIETLYSDAKGDHLDIGSGTGLMIEMAEKFHWNSYGIEPNAISNQIAEKKGLRVKQGWFPQDRFEGVSFDLVTMIDVLEHIADADGFLKATHRSIKPGKLLFIQVPNLHSLCLQLSGPDHHSNNGLFHVNYFSAETLKAIVEKAGFRHLHTESILTEMSIISQYTNAQIQQKLGELDSNLTAANLTADAILDHMLGYKLIAIFQKV